MGLGAYFNTLDQSMILDVINMDVIATGIGLPEIVGFVIEFGAIGVQD